MFEYQVSILMPSYNSARFISEAIESVRNQTIAGWELIVVDDCSTDNSVEIISEFLDDPRIQLYQLDANQGAAIARNFAIQQAKGRYIAFLDSDDVWFPNKLQVQLDYMKEKAAPFVYSEYEKISEAGRKIGTVAVPERVNYDKLLKTCVIGCLTAVYDREYFGTVEMPLIRKRQDFGLWLRLLRNSDYAYGIQENLAQYRVYEGSISSNKLSAARYTWKLYREVEKLSLIRSSYNFAFYALLGFLRNQFPSLAKRIGLFD